MALRRSKKSGRQSLAQAIRNNRERLLQGGMLLVLLLVCLFHLRAAFLAQLAVNDGTGALYFGCKLTDPNALARLARKEHLAGGDLAGALDLYNRALANFVLHVPSWLGLAELYSDLGEKEKAAAALRFVDAFAANNEKNAWTKAMLAHQLDQTQIMAANLVWLAARFPNKRRQAFALADQRWPDADKLLDQFAPSFYPDILEYYLGINEAAKADTAWGRLAKAGAVNPKIALRYVNSLLGREKTREAATVWREYFRQTGGLLYNRELREPFLGSGFGWRISRAEGVSWKQAGSGDGLLISFDGSANVSFSLSQFVPLLPGRYVFSGTIASQDLTTDQRPYWQITGHRCEGLQVRGEMVPPSGPPETFSFAFQVPEGCEAVQVALKRNTTHYFDNKIAGTVTVSGLQLVHGEEQVREEHHVPGSGEGPNSKTESTETNIGINRIKVY